MERQAERDLAILSAIEEERSLSQRALANRLGVALGLTNLLLKRLAKKGYIKIIQFPTKPAARKRLQYLLTPQGIAEKTRLTYEHMSYSLGLYRRARQTLRDSLRELPSQGIKRVALCGTGEPAELAYLSLKEFGLEPVGVFASEAGGTFLGFPVRPLGELQRIDYDGVILATFDRPERHLAELERANVPAHKVLALRRPPAPRGEASA